MDIFIDVVLYGAMGMMIFVLICCFIESKHIDVVFKNQMIILDAIRQYSMDCIYNDRPIEVTYSDMEHSDNTYNRLWDWGYTRILPPEKLEIVKPYIKK